MEAAVASQVVTVGRSDVLNGLLRFQYLGDQESQLLDMYGTLSRHEHIRDLVKEWGEQGIEPSFTDEVSEAQYRALLRICTEPFSCSSPWLQRHSLYDFQHVGIGFAHAARRSLLTWSTGAGKTVSGALLAQRLFDDGDIDVAIFVCKRSKQIDWEKFLNLATTMKVERVRGNLSRPVRHERYEQSDAQAWVMNYEKLRSPDRRGSWSRTDLQQILDLVAGKRVLLVFDEAQKLGNFDSLISKGAKILVESLPFEDVRCLALTATPYMTSPQNIWNIFNVVAPGFLDEQWRFHQEYVRKWVHGDFGAKPIWNEKHLPRLGKRMAPRTHQAFDDDPELRDQFPQVVEIPHSLQLSEADQKVYDLLSGKARGAWEKNTYAQNLANFGLMRAVCNTTAGLLFSKSPTAKVLLQNIEVAATSEKFIAVQELIDSIIETEKKVIVFSFWKNMTLAPFQDFLGVQGHRYYRDVPLYRYIGGMSEDDASTSISKFIAEKKAAILIASDAAQDGLDIYAHNVINIETPYTHSAYIQRYSRAKRIDSKEHGVEHINVHRFITEGSVEVGVEGLVQRRKRQAQLIEGRGDSEDIDAQKLTARELRTIMFGSK